MCLEHVRVDLEYPAVLTGEGDVGIGVDVGRSFGVGAVGGRRGWSLGHGGEW